MVGSWPGAKRESTIPLRLDLLEEEQKNEREKG